MLVKIHVFRIFTCIDFSLDSVPELQASNYGLSGSLNLSGIAAVPEAADLGQVPLADLEAFLKNTYCGFMSLEVNSIEVGI